MFYLSKKVGDEEQYVSNLDPLEFDNENPLEYETEEQAEEALDSISQPGNKTNSTNSGEGGIHVGQQPPPPPPHG